jgi:mandelate racemase
VKFKVAYSQVEQDPAVIRAARSAAGKDLRVMVDYNKSLSVPKAIRRVQSLEEKELIWVEEPTRADDFAGHVRIGQRRRAGKDGPEDRLRARRYRFFLDRQAGGSR